MADLTLISYGFVLYPVRGGSSCGDLVVPAVSALPHECQLWVPATATVQPPLTARSAFGGLVVDLSDCTVTFRGLSGSGAADCQDFGLVPDFSSLCCGVSLPSQWRGAKKKGLNVVVGLGGGALTARPDLHTGEFQWAWNTCDGSPVQGRRISSLTTYEATWADTHIDIARLQGSTGTNGTITLAGAPSTVALLSDAVGRIDEEQLAEFDFAHAAATVNLCSITEPLTVTLGKGTKDGSGPKAYPLPQDLEQFFRFDVHFLRGRPNCGARQMDDPN